MAQTELHKKKRAKNYMVLGLIVVFMIIFYMITVIRLTEGVNNTVVGG
jgi:hypothetical protein